MKTLGGILPLRSPTHRLALGVGVATWLAGFIAVYLLAPLDTGRGLLSGYWAFQPGSQLGNALALAIYALWGAGVFLMLRRSRLGTAGLAVAAHGLIGVGIYYPATVMSLGVAHVTDVQHDAPVYGDIALWLVLSGGVTLLVWGGLLLMRRFRERTQHRGITRH